MYSAKRRGQQSLMNLIMERDLPFTVYDADFGACLLIEDNKDSIVYTMLQDSTSGISKKGDTFTIADSMLCNWYVEPIDN